MEVLVALGLADGVGGDGGAIGIRVAAEVGNAKTARVGDAADATTNPLSILRASVLIDRGVGLDGAGQAVGSASLAIGLAVALLRGSSKLGEIVQSAAAHRLAVQEPLPLAISTAGVNTLVGRRKAGLAAGPARGFEQRACARVNSAVAGDGERAAVDATAGQAALPLRPCVAVEGGGGRLVAAVASHLHRVAGTIVDGGVDNVGIADTQTRAALGDALDRSLPLSVGAADELAVLRGGLRILLITGNAVNIADIAQRRVGARLLNGMRESRQATAIHRRAVNAAGPAARCAARQLAATAQIALCARQCGSVAVHAASLAYKDGATVSVDVAAVDRIAANVPASPNSSVVAHILGL